MARYVVLLFGCAFVLLFFRWNSRGEGIYALLVCLLVVAVERKLRLRRKEIEKERLSR